jgi:RimJ/RimL family protein N-acetyltransferase
MPWCHPEYSIMESRSWLDVQVPAFEAGTAFEFAIVSTRGHYLGGCGLNQIDKANNRANLGYWVRSTAARRGAATAAVRSIRKWAFENTNLVRLEIVVATGNAASHRVAEKAGAVREGVLRRRLLLHGVAHDATMFSFTREPANLSSGRFPAATPGGASDRPIAPEPAGDATEGTVQ